MFHCDHTILCSISWFTREKKKKHSYLISCLGLSNENKGIGRNDWEAEVDKNDWSFRPNISAGKSEDKKKSGCDWFLLQLGSRICSVWCYIFIQNVTHSYSLWVQMMIVLSVQYFSNTFSQFHLLRFGHTVREYTVSVTYWFWKKKKKYSWTIFFFVLQNWDGLMSLWIFQQFQFFQQLQHNRCVHLCTSQLKGN